MDDRLMDDDSVIDGRRHWLATVMPRDHASSADLRTLRKLLLPFEALGLKLSHPTSVALEKMINRPLGDAKNLILAKLTEAAQADLSPQDGLTI